MEKLLETFHRIIMGDARRMEDLQDQSIDLVVTSPPYPMIQMWDELFSANNVTIAEDLALPDPDQAFAKMHHLLDGIWDEVVRVLKPGGMACINIGDATRSFKGQFQLFANHAKIISSLRARGMSQLPTIIWRKTTNAPNKFMGSGMLPPGAYVTLEHEYILLFRNGSKRSYSQPDQKIIRRESAYFWEERNVWFSDVWTDLRGVYQKLDNGGSRHRSAAFPIELPHRLISMFSMKDQKILDPFMGTGTTMLAAMCTGRHSVGFESDTGLQATILERVASAPELANQIIRERLEAHGRFVAERTRSKGDLKHQNRNYGFPVMTRQEEDLYFDPVHHVQYQSDRLFKIIHAPDRSRDDQSGLTQDKDRTSQPAPIRSSKGRQMKLF